VHCFVSTTLFCFPLTFNVLLKRLKDFTVQGAVMLTRQETQGVAQGMWKAQTMHMGGFCSLMLICTHVAMIAYK
jgi:hypothetical protein